MSQISTSSGTRPLWARNGRELFYLDGANLVAVPIKTVRQTLAAGNATKLFEARYYSAIPYRTYDVSPDGQRFLMIKDAASGDEKTTPASTVVVEHWFEELKQKLQAK